MKRHRRLVQLGSLAILVGVVSLSLTHAQYLRDEVRLYHYQPAAAIQQLATETTMTSSARRIFYVNHPVIQTKTSFIKDCVTQEQTIVLGCYHGGQNGIYLLDVTDPRLAGVEQVTAAHEMLHAAYDRLSSAERTRVDGLLLDYYHNQLHDARIQATIEAYKKTEPNDLVNEMHSIFGTEVAQLPPALEQYYQQYFTNRAAITTAASAYDTEFTSRQAQVASDDQQLASWRIQITTEQAALQTEAAAITQQHQQLDASRQAGDISAYNAAVPAYNARVNQYNQRVVALHQLVSNFNDLVAQRNAIALEVNQLVQAISATTLPATK